MKRITTTLSEINVTPFVDVMLVLLVIFMVTTPLLEKEIDVDLPKADARNVEAIPAGIITVKKNRRVYFNKKRVKAKDLENILKKAYKGKTDSEVFLKADKNLPYGVVINIMEIIKKAGIEKMGMITEAPEK